MTDRCNTCGETFGESEGMAWRQSLKNRRWLATLDDSGNVVAECCEQCAQDLDAMAEDENW